VKKLLDTKRAKLEELKELNRQAELTRGSGKSYTIFFQRKYATLILDLERLNADLNSVLKDVSEYCQEVAPDEFPNESFSFLKDVTMSQARALVSSYNVTPGSDNNNKPAEKNGEKAEGTILNDQNALQLVTRILALFLQVKVSTLLTFFGNSF
jgi:hypothetical protein